MFAGGGDVPFILGNIRYARLAGNRRDWLAGVCAGIKASFPHLRLPYASVRQSSKPTRPLPLLPDWFPNHVPSTIAQLRIKTNQGTASGQCNRPLAFTLFHFGQLLTISLCHSPTTRWASSISRFPETQGCRLSTPATAPITWTGLCVYMYSTYLARHVRVSSSALSYPPLYDGISWLAFSSCFRFPVGLYTASIVVVVQRSADTAGGFDKGSFARERAVQYSRDEGTSRRRGRGRECRSRCSGRLRGRAAA
ncbi:hypothetical protein V8C35DRAFT_14942 [Trichoderma chlorosporum]